VNEVIALIAHESRSLENKKSRTFFEFFSKVRLSTRKDEFIKLFGGVGEDKNVGGNTMIS
jgi:hypothetical protein